MVKTQCSNVGGLGFDFQLGAKIPHAACEPKKKKMEEVFKAVSPQEGSVFPNLKQNGVC